MRLSVLLASLLVAAPALGQESKLHAEFRREGERIKEKCTELNAKKIFGCTATLVTDHPLHVALGSIAPQNGFGFGLAFVTRHAPSESWRLSWNADAVGALGGAWRAGGYMKIIHTPVEAPTVITKPGTASRQPPGAIREYAVLNLYAQTISLPKLSFFGLGPETKRDARSFFGMRQTILGANAIVPVTRLGRARALNLSLLGEINGRLARVRGAGSDDRPSIENLYTEETTPGLARQPGFVQFGEGVRVKPAFFNGGFRLNYLAQLQQFLAPSDSTYSFRRWTVDLKHEVPLYRTSLPPSARDTNGPNECAIDPATDACPSISRNRTGTVAIRLFVSRSGVSGRSVVPFYFQQTLGGRDINGNPALPSYDDYRFRGPHVILLQESLEHSIWGPIGLWLAADQGKVALEREDGKTDFRDLRRSFAAGVTLRAGGFPAVLLSWATGDAEGSHVAFTMSTSLLGGSARPSLH